MIDCFTADFEERERERGGGKRNIGIELKFPAVYGDGTAVSLSDISRSWQYFHNRGWELLYDVKSSAPIGVKRRRGERREDILGVETSFCKIEFSLAYEKSLFALGQRIEELRRALTDYAQEHRVYLLGLGIHPITPPSKALMAKNSRNLFWDKAFSNDSVHLFTVTAENQAHVDINLNEACDAVNVFNGLSGAQIALTANSSVWSGGIDHEYKAVREAFWDWWLPNEGRVGVPLRRFDSFEDYIDTICKLKPVFIIREGKNLGIHRYNTFSDYYSSEAPLAETEDGHLIKVAPDIADFALHNTFCWYDARISHYCTLENRVNCQQPPDEMMVIPALTLGLVENLSQAKELVDSYSWEELIASRRQAIHKALKAKVGGKPITEFCQEMLTIAEEGLKRRGLGEEVFLSPLWRRLEEENPPAKATEEVFQAGGGPLLVQRFAIHLPRC